MAQWLSKYSQDCLEAAFAAKLRYVDGIHPPLETEVFLGSIPLIIPGRTHSYSQSLLQLTRGGHG